MREAGSLKVALLYKALKSLDITRLFSAWNEGQDEAFALTTELCGASARITRGMLSLKMVVHMIPCTGDAFSNVLSGAPDRARLSTLIAGHRHHVVVEAEGAPQDELLSTLRSFASLLCDLCPPEALHWQPAHRLFTMDEFIEAHRHSGRARFLMRAAQSGQSVKLVGAQDVLGNEIRVLGGELPFEIAEALAFQVAERQLDGWMPKAGETMPLQVDGVTHAVKLGLSSDNVLCLRVNGTSASDADATQDRKRVTKLALVMAKAGEAVPGLAEPCASEQEAAQPVQRPASRPKRAADEEALRAVFRPGMRLTLNRWRGA